MQSDGRELAPMSATPPIPQEDVPTVLPLVVDAENVVRLTWTPPASHDRRGRTEIYGAMVNDVAQAHVLDVVGHPPGWPYAHLEWQHFRGRQVPQWYYWLRALSPDGVAGPWVALSHQDS
jgi:hypothetical protein